MCYRYGQCVRQADLDGKRGQGKCFAVTVSIVGTLIRTQVKWDQGMCITSKVSVVITLICTVCAIRLSVLPARYVQRQADLHGMCDQVRCLAVAVSVVGKLLRSFVGPG